MIKKAREFQENIYFCFIDYAKPFWLCGSKKTVGNSERDGNTRPPDLPLENLYAGQKEQTELDMEQQTGSVQRKEYIKAVYCHPAYLTNMQSTS